MSSRKREEWARGERDMADERRILVAVEDMMTATTVAATAARAAAEDGATEIILLHVLSAHPTLRSLLHLPEQAAATPGEGETVLELAERAVRAQCAALGVPAPSIAYELTSGEPATEIARVASEQHVTLLVLGARRPGAFGLNHPDVRGGLGSRVTCPVRVAALQAGPAQT
jgi:nucleotide-binding universal stress UspA family protein